MDEKEPLMSTEASSEDCVPMLNDYPENNDSGSSSTSDKEGTEILISVSEVDWPFTSRDDTLRSISYYTNGHVNFILSLWM